MSDNICHFIGNLTRDPELRFTTGGMAVTSGGIALSKRVKDEQGNWKDGDTTFVNFVAFRQLAENIAASCKKGDRVFIAGPLQVRDYDRDDGTKGRAVEVVVDDFGPSLKWATTTSERTTRSSNGGDSSPFPPADQPEESF